MPHNWWVCIPFFLDKQIKFTFQHTRTDLCKLMHGTLENWDLEQKIIQEAEQRSDAYYEFLNLRKAEFADFQSKCMV